MRHHALWLGLGSLAAICCPGCDAVGEVLAVTFCTADEPVALDLSALPALTTTGSLPSVPCGDQNDCSGAEALIDCTGQPFECDISCIAPGVGGSGGLCDIELTATVEQSVEVDLSQEVGKIPSSGPIDITLSRVEYSVQANTLTVDTPETEVFVGPASATRTTDPGVVQLATLPTIPAGATPQDQAMTPSPAGEAKLIELAKAYETPFRVFARTKVSVKSGDELPSGSMSLTVKACFKATP